MKSAEIRELTTKEIEERIEENDLLLTKQRLNHAVSPLENPQQIKNIRREIARLKTELRQRQEKQ
ncbi:MAG: 50S ribosomal protein L29 [Bacteroidia bacterium]|nr:MAG: 50S ribosomal protein L29 [Bacteroidia bacterium]